MTTDIGETRNAMSRGSYTVEERNSGGTVGRDTGSPVRVFLADARGGRHHRPEMGGSIRCQRPIGTRYSPVSTHPAAMGINVPRARYGPEG